MCREGHAVGGHRVEGTDEAEEDSRGLGPWIHAPDLELDLKSKRSPWRVFLDRAGVGSGCGSGSVCEGWAWSGH